MELGLDDVLVRDRSIGRVSHQFDRTAAARSGGQELYSIFQKYRNVILSRDEALMLGYIASQSTDIDEALRAMTSIFVIKESVEALEKLAAVKPSSSMAEWCQQFFEHFKDEVFEKAVDVAVQKPDEIDSFIQAYQGFQLLNARDLQLFVEGKFPRAKVEEGASGYLSRPTGENYRFFKALTTAFIVMK